MDFRYAGSKRGSRKGPVRIKGFLKDSGNTILRTVERLEQAMVRAGDNGRDAFLSFISKDRKEAMARIRGALKTAGRMAIRMEGALVAAGDVTARQSRSFVRRTFLNDNSRYRSLRSRSLITWPARMLARLELALITLGEMVAQLVRGSLGWLVDAMARLVTRLSGGKSPERRTVGAGVCLLAAATAALVFYNVMPNAYAVELDGRQVAVVEDFAEVEQAVKDYVAESSRQYNSVYYTDNISYEPVRADREELADASEIRQLCSELNFMARGWRMFIDGNQVAVLQSREEGEAIIKELVDSFTPDLEGAELVIENVKIEQEIEYKQAEVEVSEFTEVEDLRQYMLVGEQAQEVYVVQPNDTLSGIAQKSGITVAELKEANPRHQDESNYLQIGEELKLNVVERPVNVVAEGYLKKQESIPFKTTYKNDSTLWRGQYKTVEDGKSGAKEVRYSVAFANGEEVSRVMVAEVVTEEPVNKVVATGTKMVAASRGDYSGGAVAWPVRGRITSPYGPRGRGYHTGLDIGARSGTPIYAAEGGVVISAGWSGGYGYLTVIDHGDGLSTAYAHQSKMAVSRGTRVSRGQLIGYVGNTGNSSGPHLHFEVRVNGRHRNPINYLK